MRVKRGGEGTKGRVEYGSGGGGRPSSAPVAAAAPSFALAMEETEIRALLERLDAVAARLSVFPAERLIAEYRSILTELLRRERTDSDRSEIADFFASGAQGVISTDRRPGDHAVADDDGFRVGTAALIPLDHFRRHGVPVFLVFHDDVVQFFFRIIGVAHVAERAVRFCGIANHRLRWHQFDAPLFRIVQG